MLHAECQSKVNVLVLEVERSCLPCDVYGVRMNGTCDDVIHV